MDRMSAMMPMVSPGRKGISMVRCERAPAHCVVWRPRWDGRMFGAMLSGSIAAMACFACRMPEMLYADGAPTNAAEMLC